MTEQLPSERVIISAPLSYAGSTQRIWRIRGNSTGGTRVALTIAAIVLVIGAWSIVTCWYFLFGLLLVPYRILRRGARKRKRQALQHREMLDAIATRSAMSELERGDSA